MRNVLASRSVLFVFVLLAFLMFAAPAVSSAAIVFSIGIAPPLLPVYAQPVCPGSGYIWEPGYWAYDDGYFWVPGTWVLIPEPGLLWTPGYWGWNGSLFVFYQGYWGPHVGFYGGINYGFGYAGAGYQGGYWNQGTFFYNRSVNNVRNLRNVYTRTVAVRNANHVSFNGPGGIATRPTVAEQAAARDRHIPPTGVQMAHVQAASRNRQLYESVNHGKPAVAATAKPAQLSGRGVVAAGAPSNKPPAVRHADRVQASRTAPGNRVPNRETGPTSSPRTARAVTPHVTNPRPQTQANVRPQVQPRPQPGLAQSHPRQANVRPQAQPRPQPREMQSQPRMAQHRLPQTQQHVAHAAPRPQMQPRPAPPARQAPRAPEKKS
jgi:hypothetical protein